MYFIKKYKISEFDKFKFINFPVSLQLNQLFCGIDLNDLLVLLIRIHNLFNFLNRHHPFFIVYFLVLIKINLFQIYT